MKIVVTSLISVTVGTLLGRFIFGESSIWSYLFLLLTVGVSSYFEQKKKHK